MRSPSRNIAASWCVLFACLFASACDQTAIADSYPEKLPEYKLEELLNAELPIEQRRAALAWFDQEALTGNRFAQYIVGSLFRAGEKLSTGLVPRDIDKAKKYLSNAAAHGALHAMAKMAEIELEDKRYLEAMIWAQLYGHYAVAPNLDKKTSYKPDGYYADLLHRIYQHIEQKQMADVAQYINNFVAQHDEDIQVGMNSGTMSGDLREQTSKLQFKPLVTDMPHHHHDCYAEYYVEFSPNGAAKRAWILDALPDTEIGKELHTVAMRVRVNPVDDDGESRFGLVPLDFSFGKYAVHQSK